MPAPGATPVDKYDQLDLGRGDDGIWRIGTKYSDGSYVIWNAEGANEELAYIAPGQTAPADIGGGRAAVINPDQSLLVYDIKNPPPQVAGAPSAGSTGAGAGGPGSTGVGAGVYPSTPFSGQTSGTGSVKSGQTGAPSTWNAASPGRNEGWGSIGAGTAGIPYGQGVPGFGQQPIDINPNDLPHLFNDSPTVAPGYIPGSGTYNQFRLDTQNQEPRFPGAPQGLFATMQGPNGPEVVNTRFGLGGTGDPTNGSEVQTPQRWITGNATDSGQAMKGDAAWRAKYGGGGGWDTAFAGVGPYQPPPPTQGAYGASGYPMQQPQQPQQYGGGGGYQDPYQNAYLDAAGGGGTGGGFFGSTVTSNWGQTQETAGKDYIATLFLRSDTPTGIGTPAWSAPPAMWQGLLEEIRAGRIYVTDPQAWAMIQEKTGATPQSIGGAATGGQNVQPGGSSTTDAIANGNAAEAADKAAYWAYQQALLAQGDKRIALEAARDAWTKTYQEAQTTGMLNGEATLAKLKQEYDQKVAAAGLTGTFDGNPTLARLQQEFAQKVSEAGLTGLWNGQKTQQAIAQENTTAMGLLGLQASLKGPRDWARYQTTFGSTPQGLKDVMGAFQGRYQLPTGTGAQASAQGGQNTVGGLAGDILSGTYGQQQQGQTQAMGNPRQADLQNWARMQPSQREMVLGQYENEGWYAPDVENIMRTAAPRYAGPSSGSYNFFAK